MCKGGGSSSSTIDPRIMSMLQQNYANAQAVANRPYQPYTGQLTAGLTPEQQQAGSLLQNAPTMGQGAIDTGINAATAGTQYQAPLIQPPSAMAASAAPGLLGGVAQAAPRFYSSANAAPGIAGTAQINPTALGSSVSAFINPFTQDVTNATLNSLNLQNRQQLNDNAERAAGEGAFGGNRLGVQNALTNSLFQQNAANTLANLNSQGFNTALNSALNVANANTANQQQTGLFNAGNTQGANLFNAGAANTAAAADAGAANQAGLFNAGALNAAGEFNAGNQQQVNLANMGAQNQVGLANLNAALSAAESNQGATGYAQQLNNAAAGLLGSLGGQQSANYLSGVNALNAFGGEQQQTQQNALNAAYQQYLNQFNYPVQMQQLLNAALSGGMGAGTTNPTAAGQATGGLLGGLGSLGSAAALLLPLL